MCGNRVDDLESRVQELEASVEGLTDELVECKLRLQELEGAVDGDLGVAAPTPDVESEPVEEQTGSAESEDEAPKSEDTESTNNTEEQQESDIIVA